MLFHHVFNELFRSWTHVAVLRTLQDTSVGFSGNQVARAAGMQPRSAFKALTALEALGIVRRQRGGREHLFTLNRDHFLVREGVSLILAAERRFPEQLHGELTSLLRRKVAAAIVFGSVARHQERPGSDLDLCCIVESQTRKDEVQEILHSAAPGIQLRYGAKVAPLLLTMNELRAKANTTLLKGILSEGKLLTGTRARSLLHG
jgi:predicted nucleotidyltransferase